jgi:tRNA 2-thiouridine synthesizing protein A
MSPPAPAGADASCPLAERRRAAASPEESGTVALNIMKIDCAGMRCPQPVLKLAVETAETPAGTVVEIIGDCPTFEKDIRTFCERRKKTLLSVRAEGAKCVIQIQY